MGLWVCLLLSKLGHVSACEYHSAKATLRLLILFLRLLRLWMEMTALGQIRVGYLETKKARFTLSNKVL